MLCWYIENFVGVFFFFFFSVDWYPRLNNGNLLTVIYIYIYSHREFYWIWMIVLKIWRTIHITAGPALRYRVVRFFLSVLLCSVFYVLFMQFYLSCSFSRYSLLTRCIQLLPYLCFRLVELTHNFSSGSTDFCFLCHISCVSLFIASHLCLYGHINIIILWYSYLILRVFVWQVKGHFLDWRQTETMEIKKLQQKIASVWLATYLCWDYYDVYCYYSMVSLI